MRYAWGGIVSFLKSVVSLTHAPHGHFLTTVDIDT